jgi:hypothetical protein
MWLFWVLVVGALLAAVSFFALAIPVVAIIVFVVCLLLAPLALRAAKNKVENADDGMTRNGRGEITDLGYLDKEKKIPRNQRAVFFGTPQWEQYKRENASFRAEVERREPNSADHAPAVRSSARPVEAPASSDGS